MGQVSDEEVFTDIAKSYQTNPEAVKNWLLSRREPNWQLLELISTLKPEIKKAVVNNGLKTLFHGLLDRYGINNKFDLLVNSAEEGVEKPNSEIFLRTCQKLEIEPTQCCFVDDNPEFIAAAKNLGISAILFKNLADLRVELGSLGVLN